MKKERFEDTGSRGAEQRATVGKGPGKGERVGIAAGRVGTPLPKEEMVSAHGVA